MKIFKKNLSLLGILGIVLSLIGILISFYSLKLHYGELGRGHWFVSSCNLSHYISCEKVNTSQYSVFLSLPIALWGFIYYGIALSFFFLLKRYIQEKLISNAITSVLLFFFTFGIVYDVYLIILSVFFIKALCIHCIATYIINIVLFILLLANVSFKEAKLSIAKFVDECWNKKNKVARGFRLKAIFSILLVFVVAFILNSSFSKAPKRRTVSKREDRIERFVNQFVNAPREDLSFINSELLIDNSPDRPIEIIEFSDFECPFCKRFALSLERSKYRGKIKIIFKNFPLDSKCNRLLNREMHPHACMLAYGGVCAARFGKFKSYYIGIMERFIESEGDLLNFISSIGINKQEFARCIRSEDVRNYVLRDIEDGMKLKVRATPTVFINGRKIEGAIPLPILDKIFERILIYDRRK